MTDLESDIQVAWEGANVELDRQSHDVREVVALIAALRDCEARSIAIGFTSGAHELKRMASYLEGRISNSNYPQYETQP